MCVFFPQVCLRFRFSGGGGLVLVLIPPLFASRKRVSVSYLSLREREVVSTTAVTKLKTNLTCFLLEFDLPLTELGGICGSGGRPRVT